MCSIHKRLPEELELFFWSVFLEIYGGHITAIKANWKGSGSGTYFVKAYWERSKNLFSFQGKD